MNFRMKRQNVARAAFARKTDDSLSAASIARMAEPDLMEKLSAVRQRITDLSEEYEARKGLRSYRMQLAQLSLLKVRLMEELDNRKNTSSGKSAAQLDSTLFSV